MMNRKEFRCEIDKLAELVGGWENPGEVPALERDLALETLRRLYEAVRFGMTEEAREGREHFRKLDMADYAKKSFGMFGGKEEKVKLLVDNSLAGVMIDRFGKDIIMVPGDEEHFTVNVTVHVSSQFLGWIFSLGEKVKILGPEEVIQAMRREGERLTEQYR